MPHPSRALGEGRGIRLGAHLGMRRQPPPPTTTWLGSPAPPAGHPGGSCPGAAAAGIQPAAGGLHSRRRPAPATSTGAPGGSAGGAGAGGGGRGPAAAGWHLGRLGGAAACAGPGAAGDLGQPGQVAAGVAGPAAVHGPGRALADCELQRAQQPCARACARTTAWAAADEATGSRTPPPRVLTCAPCLPPAQTRPPCPPACWRQRSATPPRGWAPSPRAGCCGCCGGWWRWDTRHARCWPSPRWPTC